MKYLCLKLTIVKTIVDKYMAGIEKFSEITNLISINKILDTSLAIKSYRIKYCDDSR